MRGKEPFGVYKSNKAPCKNCKQRYLGCNSKCEKYAEFCKMNEERKEALNKERMLSEPSIAVKRRLTRNKEKPVKIIGGKYS